MNIFGITGWKNSGKTTLMEKLVTEMTGRGLTVSTVKHAHHSVEIDQKGKDSHRHRVAGAQQVLLASQDRWALITETRDQPEPTLEDLLRQFDPVDLILIEGYKRDAHAKIETHRHATPKEPAWVDDPTIIAVATDAPSVHDGCRTLDINDASQVADFILSELGMAYDVKNKVNEL